MRNNKQKILINQDIIRFQQHFISLESTMLQIRQKFEQFLIVILTKISFNFN